MINVSQLTNFVQNKLNEYTQTTTRTADVGIVLQVGDGSVVFTTDVTFNYNISTIPSGGFSGIGTLPAGSSQVFITSYDPMLEQISSTQVNNFNPSPVDGYIIDTIN